MDISTLMEIGGGNLKLEVTAADLTKFAKDVVDMTLAARSKELTKTGANAINGETYLSSGQVCEKLGIAKYTLWLWQKRGIIAPKKVGSHNRYALSDIVRLLNNGLLITHLETVAATMMKLARRTRHDTGLETAERSSP